MLEPRSAWSVLLRVWLPVPAGESWPHSWTREVESDWCNHSVGLWRIVTRLLEVAGITNVGI